MATEPIIQESDEILDAVDLLVSNDFIVFKKNQQIIDQIELLKEYYPPATKEEATGTISTIHYRQLIEDICGEICLKELSAYLKVCGYIPTATPDGVEFLIK